MKETGVAPAVDKRYVTMSQEIAQVLLFHPDRPDEDGAVGVAATKHERFLIDARGRAIDRPRLNLVKEYRSPGEACRSEFQT